MNKKNFKHLLLLTAGLLVMATTSGCGIRYSVHGTVIDMDTGQPVEGAVVSIKWEKENFSLPGMGRSFTFLELADDITGPDGKFKIPKYTFRDCHLAVYKKGYVCWESEDIFPDYKKRGKLTIHNRMMVELEPFRNSYSKEKHAIFVESVNDDNANWENYQGKLFKATEQERSLYQQMRRGEEAK
jgi:hypothetical protein